MKTRLDLSAQVVVPRGNLLKTRLDLSAQVVAPRRESLEKKTGSVKLFTKKKQQKKIKRREDTDHVFATFSSQRSLSKFHHSYKGVTVQIHTKLNYTTGIDI